MNKDQTTFERFEGKFTLISTLADLMVVLGAVLNVILGININLNWFITAALILLVTIPWLIYSAAKAYRRIKERGDVQNPKWFWRLVLGRIITESKPLNKATIMLIVPPELKNDLNAIRDGHNKNKITNLCFHYLPALESNDEKLNEDGENSKGSPRSVETLTESLKTITSIVLFDNGDWSQFKNKYPLTWKIINDWSNTHTSHPIISIQVGEDRTFKYSWGDFSEVKRNNQALALYLLDQSVARAEAWENQSKLQRRTFRICLTAIIACLIVSVIFNYLYREEIRTSRVTHQEEKEDLQAKQKSFEMAMRKLPNEQAELMKRIAIFRESNKKTDPQKLKNLLDFFASQLKDKIISSTSNKVTSAGVDIILFAVKDKIANIKDPKIYDIKEVAATRELLDANFWYSPNITQHKSIVSCSVGTRAFIYLSLDESGKELTNIEGWSLTGEKLEGNFSKDKRIWEYNGNSCEYSPILLKEGDKSITVEDNPRRYLFCAPVGVANDSLAEPVGAMCISSYDNLNLEEEWARHLVISYGNSLSFFNWESALISNNKDTVKKENGKAFR